MNINKILETEPVITSVNLEHINKRNVGEIIDSVLEICEKKKADCLGEINLLIYLNKDALILIHGILQGTSYNTLYHRFITKIRELEIKNLWIGSKSDNHIIHCFKENERIEIHSL